MDYRALLVKYIRHVFDSEGVTFIPVEWQIGSDVEFTDEEKAELRRLDPTLEDV